MSTTTPRKLVTDTSASKMTRLVTADLNTTPLHDGWWDADPARLRARFAFPMFWGSGNTSTTVLYVELDPGCGNGRHTDSAEELLLVLEGEVEVEVDGERGILVAGGLALVPALVPHAFRNVGTTVAKVVGFFSSNVVLAEFEDAVQPLGRLVVGTPTPEMVEQSRGEREGDAY